MTRFTTIFLMSLTMFAGACDEADQPIDEVERADGVEDAREGRRGGKFAKLDADQDGAITLAEAKGSRLEHKFTKLDADKDGRLTRDEMKAMKRHRGEGRGFHKDPAERAEKLLSKLDADKDGKLSQAEFAAKFKGEPNNEHAAKFAAKFAEKFVAADADKDGKLDRAELTAMKRGHHGDPAQRAERILGKLDADKNGSLSPAELAGDKFGGKLREADADGDGQVTREELAGMKLGRHGHGMRHKDPAQRAEWVLGKLDADKDGAISKAEVDGSRFADKFAAVDADGDTRVTREELLAFKPARGERDGGERRGR